MPILVYVMRMSLLTAAFSKCVSPTPSIQQTNSKSRSAALDPARCGHSESEAGGRAADRVITSLLFARDYGCYLSELQRRLELRRALPGIMGSTANKLHFVCVRWCGLRGRFFLFLSFVKCFQCLLSHIDNVLTVMKRLFWYSAIAFTLCDSVIFSVVLSLLLCYVGIK